MWEQDRDGQPGATQGEYRGLPRVPAPSSHALARGPQPQLDEHGYQQRGVFNAAHPRAGGGGADAEVVGSGGGGGGGLELTLGARAAAAAARVLTLSMMPPVD